HVPRDVERTGLTAALNKRKDRVLVTPTARLLALLHSGLGAKVRFVSLDDAAAGTHLRGVVGLPRLHRFAQAMLHEPCSFVRHAKRAVELVSRESFLARCHQIRGQNPLVERDLGALEYGADRDRKRLAAAITLVETRARRFARHLADFLGLAAVRAERSVGP